MKKNKNNECKDAMNIEKKVNKIIKNRVNEKMPKSDNHQKLYERLVDEAVLLIAAKWEEEAKYVDLKFEKRIEAKNIFIITKDELKIFANSGYTVQNPKTGRCCFFDTFNFESMKEVEKYIEDVTSRLPKRTEVICKEGSIVPYEKLGLAFGYSFRIEIH